MELYLMFTITDRMLLHRFVALYQENSVPVNFITLGRGTASGDTLSRFGLERTEKAVCFAVVTPPVWRTVKRALERQLRIDVPGTGIAFIMPMSSIGGKRELMFLTDGQGYEKGDESVLKNTIHELLIVVANQGFSEQIMDAARQSGATGGTVVHARGTGMKRSEQFLGISLASEKELIFIVTSTSEKNGIMQSIMRHAGPETRAQAIVFSLPVTDTAGLRLLDEQQDN